MTRLDVLAWIGMVVIAVAIFAAVGMATLLLAREVTRLERRWAMLRPVLAADLAMLRAGLRLAAAHWRQARAVLAAASQAGPGRPEA